MRSTLRGGTAAYALAMLGAGVGMVALSAPAAAQDYTTGAITGTVVDAGNKPVAGIKVTLRSLAQNQSRTYTTSATGGFSAVGLTPGQYQLTAEGDAYRTQSDTARISARRQSLEHRSPGAYRHPSARAVFSRIESSGIHMAAVF
ncbi:carboxypeptidase-like regulatory domain-containing protein [uncultured Sphingomonas sp.]|uniref:carboxypeptidase-like regulatory domain-containing protein n=1 Tax=uncultured Sphingomonas sp. TaxID=158754 RepID=UPI0025ED0084|nr:carboxypeptidase-like regulatory domain-containing protein [uncultured Sphingomonas sp.]